MTRRTGSSWACCGPARTWCSSARAPCAPRRATGGLRHMCARPRPTAMTPCAAPAGFPSTRCSRWSPPAATFPPGIPRCAPTRSSSPRRPEPVACTAGCCPGAPSSTSATSRSCRPPTCSPPPAPGAAAWCSLRAGRGCSASSPPAGCWMSCSSPSPRCWPAARDTARPGLVAGLRTAPRTDRARRAAHRAPARVLPVPAVRDARHRARGGTRRQLTALSWAPVAGRPGAAVPPARKLQASGVTMNQETRRAGISKGRRHGQDRDQRPGPHRTRGAQDP